MTEWHGENGLFVFTQITVFVTTQITENSYVTNNRKSKSVWFTHKKRREPLTYKNDYKF